jgi:hypothetical protein
LLHCCVHYLHYCSCCHHHYYYYLFIIVFFNLTIIFVLCILTASVVIINSTLILVIKCFSNFFFLLCCNNLKTIANKLLSVPDILLLTLQVLQTFYQFNINLFVLCAFEPSPHLKSECWQPCDTFSISKFTMCTICCSFFSSQFNSCLTCTRNIKFCFAMCFSQSVQLYHSVQSVFTICAFVTFRLFSYFLSVFFHILSVVATNSSQSLLFACQVSCFFRTCTMSNTESHC